MALYVFQEHANPISSLLFCLSHITFTILIYLFQLLIVIEEIARINGCFGEKCVSLIN